MTQDPAHLRSSENDREVDRETCPLCGGPSTTVPAFLTKAELAKVLKKSTRWVEIQVKNQEMPTTMVGGTPRFELQKVLDWLNEVATTGNGR